MFSWFQCQRYRQRYDQIARNRMREKVTASIIFKSRKASYPKRYFHILSWLILTKIYIICKLVSRSNHLETKRLSIEKKQWRMVWVPKSRVISRRLGENPLWSRHLTFYFTYFRFLLFLARFCNLVAFINNMTWPL